MKTFDYPWIQETVESIHRKQPTTKELMQAGSRSAEVNAKLDKWIDAKIPPVGAYYMPKWLGKVDIEDSVEYDSLGLPEAAGRLRPRSSVRRRIVLASRSEIRYCVLDR